MASATNIKIFCCCVHENSQDQQLLQKLIKHLTPLKWHYPIEISSEKDIHGGDELERKLHKYLNEAHIILLLISPDFLASRDHYDIQSGIAMQRHEKGDVCVIPIILRRCGWKKAKFHKLEALPKNGEPAVNWSNEDDAFANIAEDMDFIVKETCIKLLLNEADNLYGNGRFQEALFHYEQAISQQQSKVAAYLGKLKTLVALQKYDDCLDMFETVKSLNLSIANISYYREKASILKQFDRFDECLATYDEALQIEPENLYFHEEKTFLLKFLERYPEALQTCKQMICLDASVAKYYAFAGELLFHLKDYNESYEMYEQALYFNPREDSYFEGKGRALFELQRYDEALKAYECALDIKEEPSYFEQKGKVLLALQSYDKALAAYERARDLIPGNNSVIYAGMGQALTHLERYREALIAYENAINIDTPNPDPQFYHAIGVIHEAMAKQAYETERQINLSRGQQNEKAGASFLEEKLGKYQFRRELKEHKGAILSLFLCSDGETLASGSDDKTIKLWNINTGHLLYTFDDQIKRISCIAISADGKILASGDTDGVIKIWSLSTHKLLYTLTEHKGAIFSLIISANGQTLVSGSWDKTIRIWDFKGLSSTLLLG